MLRPVSFRPVMTWKARVAMLRPAPAGTPVSYSRQAVAPRDMMLAVVSAGDADGYLRQLTNLGRVLIGGHVCAVVGRVCMDMFMADVTDVPEAAEGDEVLLLGADSTGHGPLSVALSAPGPWSQRHYLQYPPAGPPGLSRRLSRAG